MSLRLKVTLLSKCIREKRYKRNCQSVAMGLKEGTDRCLGYIEKWREELHRSGKSAQAVNHCINRMKFLRRRVEDMNNKGENSDMLSRYKTIYDQLTLFENYLTVLEMTQPRGSSRTFQDSTGVIENWTHLCPEDEFASAGCF